MTDTQKVIKRQRRSNAVWYLYVNCGFTMQEIADIFKIAKSHVFNILETEAKFRIDELKRAKI